MTVPGHLIDQMISVDMKECQLHDSIIPKILFRVQFPFYYQMTILTGDRRTESCEIQVVPYLITYEVFKSWKAVLPSNAMIRRRAIKRYHGRQQIRNYKPQIKRSPGRGSPGIRLFNSDVAISQDDRTTANASMHLVQCP